MIYSLPIDIKAREIGKITEHLLSGPVLLGRDHTLFSRSSRKRPPREFEKVVVTGAGRLREYALVSDPC